MSATLSAELCRITVIGPARRVDLAVPATTTVATLLPLLVQQTTDTGPRLEPGASDGAAWVLQRLGQAPFELAGTPESLDWLEGEQLHLCPAADPLPELDFDDLADGVATTVNRRNDRWQPEYRRILFALLSVVAMGAIVVVLTAHGPALPQVVAGSVLSIALLAAALVCGRRLDDGAFSLLFAGGAVGFAAVAASSAVDGDPERIAVTGAAVLATAVASLTVAAVLLLAQRTFAPYLPVPPLLGIGVTGLVTALVLLMRDGSGMTMQRTAAVAILALLVVIVLAPRLAVKLSRLRGPQLPKTSEDMSYDIEPAPSDEVRRRTDDADTYLTAAMATSAVVLPALFHFTMQVPGWAGWSFVLVVASAILLRSRTFLGLWQRIALVVAGTVGYLMVITKLADLMSPAWRWVLLSALVALLVPLVLAALRPWPRRMLPFWEYAATFFDVTTGVAVLPILAQILGIYAWARGLFG
ncbi:type VII secretion integral membrane protein EccD [Micromonospora matsumotoense]|uniref:Type VII secretion integral membrane protein EccD n=1 Tax=Micromonospora matsumotoense TaxID=121616 RepID=A0A1C5A4N9_9ACTN|nr:type VII secretion integral membrane protein EccD [Micromonospora matsumotoense]SCF40051.1 type VII secretion integral membrane protein EccD [Micromonospora matsumotoense]